MKAWEVWVMVSRLRFSDQARRARVESLVFASDVKSGTGVR